MEKYILHIVFHTVTHGVDELGDYSVSIERNLDDVRVWRTIINGYPYKSASELGVSSGLDAYVATKQAIYSVLLNRDVYSLYRGRTDRGNKIVNAIYNLTNIGRHGTQTPQNSQLTIAKSGDMYEQGDYYIQKFNVSSAVDIASYIITSSTLPSGAIITDSNGTQKTIFNGKESCYLRIPKSSMNVDINANITIQGKCKTYPVFYGKTSISGAQNYAVTFDPYGDDVTRVNLNVKTDTGKILINKTDDETHKPIKGVTFQLTKEDGTIIANATTNENGVATFSSLYQGKYILKETATNEKYILNTKEFNVDVEYNKTTTVNIENEHKKGNVKVYKVDKDNNRVVLGNVEFGLYSHEFGKVIGTYNTDVNGELLIENLRIGDYSLIETKTNKWYNLADDTDVEVEWNLTKELQIENELKKGTIKVIKVDKDDNEVKLENVKFNVMDKEGNVLEQLITDENGEAQTSRYAIRDFSELKIQEIETLDNYVLDNEVYTIVLEENQIKDLTFENEKIKGYIQVTKTSSEDNKYSKLPKGSPLSDVTFEIYDSENNKVDTITTDSTGTAVSKELIKGCYTIKEISSAKYYLLNTNIYNAEIIKNQEIVNVDITNDNVNIDVEIEKKGFIETQSKDKIFYTFSNIQNKSNVELDNFTWEDNLPTEALRIDKIYTGIWNQDLEYAVYYKTNLSDEYALFKDNLNTQQVYELDFDSVELKENEYITSYQFRFGTVEIGFKEVESPILYCNMLDKLPNGFVFTNKTKVSGTYFEAYVEDNDEWTTITYKKEIELNKTLPRTRILK